MDPEIQEEPLRHLSQHALISVAFEVDRVLDLVPMGDGLRGFELRERQLAAPYVKDYDAIVGNRPTDWQLRFDLSTWGLLSARLDGECVGGVAVAFKTQGLYMLEGRTDLAVVWDLRVSPAARGRKLGSALFSAAEQWAKARGCTQLKVETQNINVAACRFYASRGCELGAIHRFAYPELPGEIQLLWYKSLYRASPPPNNRMQLSARGL